MVSVDVFKDASIDKNEYEQSLQVAAHDKKGNLIPKGLVSLEKLYDL